MNRKIFGVSEVKYTFKTSREQRELPWQPNLDKISQNSTNYNTVQKNAGIFRTYTVVCRVAEFEYAT